MSVTENKYISRMNDFGEVLDRQHSFYGSGMIRKVIESGGVYTSERSGISYRIPTHFGFCYGVEKSIDMAFETVRRFPDRRIYLTHDVIHNPKVNQDLAEKNVRVLPRDDENRLKLDSLTEKDVVVIAAFGSKAADVEALRRKNCVVVDTTCGAIVVVWKRVEKYAKTGFTSVIHGIWNHEETQATASQATRMGGHFVIVRNLAEARKIEDFLAGKVSSVDFMKIFGEKSSRGFEPVRDLQKIGIASQTTMYKEETLEIQEYLRGVYENHFGKPNSAGHFLKYDTICSATQERQDALAQLLANPLDLMLIIGGFNSSNTTHLSEISAMKYPSFHIQGPEDILSPDEIRHLDPVSLEVRTTRGWFKPGIRQVGITTGASTPDILIERVIGRIEDYRS